MLPPRLTPVALLLLLALANSASAQDAVAPTAAQGAVAVGFDQVVYKGLVGNVLDAVPMDPLDRLGLQRTNAVLSNTLLGRSLTVLAGLSNPVLLLGGFAWGMWAATNIRAAEAGSVLVAGEVMPAKRAPMPIQPGSTSAADVTEPVLAQPRVFRVWLPQRSSALGQSQ